LIDICQTHAINVIIPGATWDSKILSKYSDLMKEKGIIALVNNHNLIEIGDDKWQTYQFLKKHNIGTPITFDDVKLALKYFPNYKKLVIKPKSGRGSKDIFISNNRDELIAITNYFKVKKIDHIIQEHISNTNKEYTVGVISDKEGHLIQSIVMQRNLFGGATGYAKVCKNGYINEFCENVAIQLQSTGPMNIQLRLDDEDNPLIFEINPRFSGSSIMRALAGFNEPDMIIRNFVFNEELKKNTIKENNEYYRVFQEIEIEAGADYGGIKYFI
jgi:carbamoyl-phosphate synthase large subunit